eukprot:TRINITY_DN6698_c0_g1_i4.p1 TRINITY_DN6698_c0_g1~~TRINITY_DN6698_c0_g1_i4.p1  ORF type:complete len:131 (+),score=6.59 TRINITY_DN6698_c0_g1_i4:27-395(+)
MGEPAQTNSRPSSVNQAPRTTNRNVVRIGGGAVPQAAGVTRLGAAVSHRPSLDGDEESIGGWVPQPAQHRSSASELHAQASHFIYPNEEVDHIQPPSDQLDALLHREQRRTRKPRVGNPFPS